MHTFTQCSGTARRNIRNALAWLVVLIVAAHGGCSEPGDANPEAEPPAVGREHDPPRIPDGQFDDDRDEPDATWSAHELTGTAYVQGHQVGICRDERDPSPKYFSGSQQSVGYEFPNGEVTAVFLEWEAHNPTVERLTVQLVPAGSHTERPGPYPDLPRVSGSSPIHWNLTLAERDAATNQGAVWVYLESDCQGIAPVANAVPEQLVHVRVRGATPT